MYKKWTMRTKNRRNSAQNMYKHKRAIAFAKHGLLMFCTNRSFFLQKKSWNFNDFDK